MNSNNKTHLMPNNIDKGLVNYGTNLGSTVGFGRPSNYVRNIVFITNEIKSLIIGLMLSDASMEKTNSKSNARLTITQSLARPPHPPKGGKVG